MIHEISCRNRRLDDKRLDMDRDIKGIVPLKGTNKKVMRCKKPFSEKKVVSENASSYISPKKSNLVPISRKERRSFIIEKSIDLHGCTKEEAYLALIKFFNSSQEEGIRKTLVITGGNSLRETTLRKSFQFWIKENFGNYVTSCSPANIWHGGEGAFYVCIKKKK